MWLCRHSIISGVHLVLQKFLCHFFPNEQSYEVKSQGGLPNLRWIVMKCPIDWDDPLTKGGRRVILSQRNT